MRKAVLYGCLARPLLVQRGDDVSSGAKAVCHLNINAFACAVASPSPVRLAAAPSALPPKERAVATSQRVCTETIYDLSATAESSALPGLLIALLGRHSSPLLLLAAGATAAVDALPSDVGASTAAVP